jgi:hypothetical protein
MTVVPSTRSELACQRDAVSMKVGSWESSLTALTA